MICWEILGLEPTATAEEVKFSYRLLAAEAHPDKGGSAQEFTRLNLAYKQALAIAEAPVVCTRCNGLGRIRHMVNWSYADYECHDCGGTGLVPRT